MPLLVSTTVNFPLLFIFPTANNKKKKQKTASEGTNRKHEKKRKKISLEEKEIIRLTLNYC